MVSSDDELSKTINLPPETIEAMKELKHSENYKIYKSAKEMWNDLDVSNRMEHEKNGDVGPKATY